MPSRSLPFNLATLLYCFNEREEVLLLQRAREPNRGLWSPCGGKLQTESGESPYACACREAQEELGLAIGPADLHLTGLVSEHAYQGNAHWLMFLFEVQPRLTALPPQHREGIFSFFPADEIASLNLDRAELEFIRHAEWLNRNSSRAWRTDHRPAKRPLLHGRSVAPGCSRL